MATLAIRIDPSGAVGPAREIRRSLDDVSNAGARAEKSVASIGKGADGTRVIKRSMDDVAKAAAGADRSVKGFTSAANDNFRRLNAQVAGVTSTFRTLLSVLGPLAALFSIRQLQLYADGWSDMQSRVGAAVKNMEAAPALMKRIVDIANASYSPLSQTVEVFGRNVAVLRDLGKSASQAADFTEALNHALVITATKGQDAEVVQNALSRAIATGGLRAMEYETIMSRSPRVLEAIAKEAGTTVTGLRALATQGKVTGAVIVDGLVKSLAELRGEAAEMPATIGDAFVRIGTNLTAFIGQMDKATGASEAISAALISVADSIKGGETAFAAIGQKLAGVAEVAAVAGTALMLAFGPAVMSALAYSFGVFVGAVLTGLTAIQAAIVANPIGAIAAAIVGAVAAAYYFRDEIEKAIGVDVFGIIKDAANFIINSFIAAYEDVKLAWERLPAALGDLVYSAANGVVAGVERMVNRVAEMIDGFIEKVNAAIKSLPFGLGDSASIGKIGKFDFGRIDNPFAGAGIDYLTKRAEMLQKVFASDTIGKFGDAIRRSFSQAADATDALNESVGNTPGAVEVAKKSYTDLIAKARERIEQMKLELTLVGKAGAATEALRFEQDLLSQVMVKFGTVTPAQRKEIHALAEEYGRLAQAIAEARMASDLTFAKEQLGRADEEQRVAEAMRSLYGDDYGKYMDSALAGQVRYIEKLKETRAELKNVNDAVKDTFTGLIDLLYSSGDATEKLIGAFAQLGKMFATMGAEKLYDYISGKSSSLFGGPASAGGGAFPRAPSLGSEKQLKEIGENLNLVGSTALDVAKQFKGLNERADAGPLDAFMQASGTWRNLSATDTAWCAAFANASIITAGGKGTGSNAASSFLNWGSGTNAPQIGDIVVLKPQTSGSSGHVGFVAGFKDGTVQVFGGNQSNAVNVKSFALDQVAAFRTDPSLLRTAVSDGVIDASKRARVGSNFQDTFDVGSTPGIAGAGGMTKMQGMLGTAGAAFGAFAGGMQSGDPLSGAIGGAFTGLGAAESVGSALGIGAMAAAPIALIGGAIIGLIGGLIGKSKQKKAELKQAQQELESQIGAITQLIATATGNFMGSFEKQFSSTTDEFQKAITLAEKAGNRVLAEKLKASMDTFFDRLTDQFQRGFEGTLASMNAGLGFDGDFVKGSDAVEKMRESLVGFVNDAKFFAEANGDLGSMLDARKREMGIGSQVRLNQPKDVWYERAGGSSGTVEEHVNSFLDGYKEIGLQLVKQGFQAFNAQGGQFYDTLTELKDAAIKAGFAIDEQGKVTKDLTQDAADMADAVERARSAAINTALAMLSGGKEFTEVEKAIQRLEGAAATLPSLLADLGMSAEDAAKAIEHHLNIALRDLVNNLTSDLTKSINDLGGFGYLNQILDAQTAYEGRVRDLQALGMDTGLALTELGLRLSNIAHEAELSDDILRQLADAFPQLSGSLLGLVGGNLGTTSQALQAAKDEVEKAKDALRRAYENEIGTLEKAKSAHESYVKSIKDFLDSLRLDSNLSPLDPTQRFQEAQRNYLETTQQALAGNEDAIGKVEEVSRQYLEEARAYYGTSEGYFAIFNDVEATLNSVLNSSQKHLSELEQQLAAMEAQRDAQLGTTDAVLSVEEAINRLAAATSAQAAAQQAYDQAQDAAIKQMLELLKQTGQAYDPFVTSLYRDVLGRSPDAEGAAYYTNMLKSGVSQEEVRRRFTANAQPELDRGYPVFADGGYHMGGLRLVGERGPELEMTGPSRIWSATDTSRILSQAWQPQRAVSNDNSWSAVVKELQELRQEVAELREERKQGDDIAAANVAATNETTQAVREQVQASQRLSLLRTG